MLSTQDAVIPSRTSKLNLLFDNILLAYLLFTLVDLPLLHHQLGLIAAGGIAWSTSMVVLRYYDASELLSRLDKFALICVGLVATGVTLILTQWVLGQLSFSSTLSALGLYGASVVLARFLVFKRLSIPDEPFEHVVVLGCETLGQITLKKLKRQSKVRLVGIYSFFDEEPFYSEQVPYLGDIDKLHHDFQELTIDRVVIASNLLQHHQDIQTTIKACEELGIPFSVPAHAYQVTRSKILSSQHIQDGYLHFAPHEVKAHQLAFKRLMDIAASLAGLVMLSPIFLLVALLIKLTSKGPIFYIQRRVGMRGHLFNMIKFRSMRVDAEKMLQSLMDKNEQTGPVFKMHNDPRITPIGKFIRKYSIDELPQLLNVLRGDMSLVGPRPPIASEVAKYKPWQKRRLSIRPGLTCYWQVSGRNNIGFEDWMYLDMRYIDHWSLKKDFALILKTLPVVVFGKGAS